jgi:hypothetical protein
MINRAEAIDWIKGSGLLVLTILGIFLYIVLSVPATVFYARLGVTPDEAGLSYTSLLSGSTIEILVILAVLTITFLSLSFTLAFLSLYLRVILIISSAVKPNSLWRKYNSLGAEVDDQEFDQQLRFLEEIATRVPEIIEMAHFDTFAELEIGMRRTRELEGLGVRTAEESAELDVLDRKSELSLNHLFSLITKRWIKRWGRLLAGIYLLTTVFVGLPTLAFVQAGEVLGGKEYVGTQLGLFNYRAELVGVSPISQAGEQGIQSLVGKPLFLIGQNTQHVILYSPATHSTIRVPTTSVIVTSVR